MSNKNDFIDRTLLSLRRQYSKDEVIAAMDKKLKKLEFENGVLKSEVHELEFLRNKKIKLEKSLKAIKDELQRTIESVQSKKGLTRQIRLLETEVLQLKNELYECQEENTLLHLEDKYCD